MQPLYAILKFLKTILVKGHVNTVVHAVTGKHKVGFGLVQHPLQSFMQVRPREGPARMARFRKARNRFAGQANINKFKMPVRVTYSKISNHIIYIIGLPGDAVTQKNDAFNLVGDVLGMG